ncbi:family 20 glycosylhydrolase [uncultured Sphingomonas sp.]|uniref:beta-N-acetylhexosaminidase n=1 Tax=uncultured Sphingomonas sp. TaxID=158754 RepID=UPI00260766FF|nr:family 20 glycosylhydrolase [uncultured Sphingomonas sp.]
MKWRISGALAGALLASGAIASPALMPLPTSVTRGEGVLPLDGPLAPVWSGCGDARRLRDAAGRLRADIDRQTGRTFAGKAVPVTIACATTSDAADKGEGYRLTVATDGIRIDAQGQSGVLRAFATLRQLVGLSPGGATLAAMTIDDAPRFAWRGVMLDTVRHFLTVDTIKRQIDAMERVKLNVLHLHLSDDQGFRVESRRFPLLTAANGGEFYTQAQIREIVAYAADRGIRVVPEIDIPAHTRAIVNAYPAIGVRGKPGALGIADTALNPASPETYRFLTALIGEMAALFPDPVFHAGGDEVPRGVWDGDESVKALMAREGLKDTRAVEHYFHRRVQQILRRAGKTMLGWEEIATGLGVESDAIVQSWQTSNATADVTARGYRTVVSAGYYLDLLMPAEFHYAIDPADSASAGMTPEFANGLRKLSPFLEGFVSDALIAFPRPPLTAAQEKLILGGEAPLWGEIVTDELVDQRLWPRAAALAERFWSARSVRDPADMYRRLGEVGALLSVSGTNDQASMARMATRLSPTAPEPVLTLLSIVGPVRNMAHDHRIKAMLAGKMIEQPLNALADAAPVDSMAARRFAAAAKRYAEGDRTLAPLLTAELTRWRDNDAGFVAISAGRPMLEAARPASAQIAALAACGLEAVAAIEAGKSLDPAAVARARGLLDTLDQQEKASWRPIESLLKPQPPADMIVKIGPGIRTLIEAAGERR